VEEVVDALDLLKDGSADRAVPEVGFWEGLVGCEEDLGTEVLAGDGAASERSQWP
jgi:hypothetical protein